MAGGVYVRASRGHLLSGRFVRDGVPESLDNARRGSGNRDYRVLFRGHDGIRDTTTQPRNSIVPNLGKTGRFAYCKGASFPSQGSGDPGAGVKLIGIARNL